MRGWGNYGYLHLRDLCSCDNVLDVEIKLTAEPDGLNVLLRLLTVGDEDNTLFGVGFNPLTAQLIE